MIRKFSGLIGAICIAATLSVTPAMAQRPNLLVMAEDADKDTVPRNNRIFNQVMQALTEELNVRGYSVIDETAAGMDITTPGRVRRGDAELIDIGRAIRNPPVDAVVIFQIYASAKQSLNSDILRPEIRIPARIINLRTSQQMAAFTVSSLEAQALPRGCDRECLLEVMGRNAHVMARDLASGLGDKLNALRPHDLPQRSGVGPQSQAGGDPAVARTAPARQGGAAGCTGMPAAYTLVFDGFAPREVTRMEEYFTSFQEFCGVRPIGASGSMAEYWYETHADAARLNRNLRLMLDHMNINGNINMAGNTIRVVKISTR